jgi:hypothetical protein
MTISGFLQTTYLKIAMMNKEFKLFRWLFGKGINEQPGLQGKSYYLLLVK